MIKNEKVTVSVKYFVLSCLFWFLSVAWLSVIIYLSCEAAADSTVRSMGVVDSISKYLGIELSETLIRKGAHVSEFGLFSFLLYFALLFTNRISIDYSFKGTESNYIRSENEYCIVFTLWISTMFAFVSEYLQLYVDGRSGSVVDVLVDLVGVILVLIIVRLFFSINIMIHNHKY